jgi:hypothetical protein
MEKEFVDCYLDRYLSDQMELYRQNPDLDSIRKEYADYVNSQEELVVVPTYYHYWEDEVTRRRMWIVTHDPVARALFNRLIKARKGIIDGKRRMKRVGDGSHTPVEEHDARASIAAHSPRTDYLQDGCCPGSER